MLVFTAFVAGCGSSSSVTTTTMAATTTTAAAVTTTTVAAVTTTTTGTTTTTLATPAPTGLTAAGTLNHIALSWGAGAGSVTGYNVYRATSPNGPYAKTGDSPVAVSSYVDHLTSSDDGIYYCYKVTALGPGGESAFSNIAKNTRGTRLATLESSGFTTQAGKSPYVAEGVSTVEGGNLIVATGTKLYVLDNAVIDLEQSNWFYVYGLLRVLATTEAPATFTSHHVGAPLADSEGFKLRIDTAVNYNPADDSGTLLQNTRVHNLAGSQSLIIVNCSPLLYNCKFSSNSSGGGSYINLYSPTAALVRNNSFTRMLLQINSDLTGSNEKIDHNIFRGSYYAIEAANLATAGVKPGAIKLNDFDGTNDAYSYHMSGGNIPVGNNYWHGASPVPSVLMSGSTATFDFTDPSMYLYSAPAGVGPNW